MRDDWVLDVLMDLRTFALKNGMDKLADKLVETTQVAASEISSRGLGKAQPAEPLGLDRK
ncbi:MAG: hypothetical protein R3D84_14725 [Paracoccaceae bacterium]